MIDSESNNWETRRNYIFDTNGNYQLANDITDITTFQEGNVKVIGSPIPEEYETEYIKHEYLNTSNTKRAELEITIGNVITDVTITEFKGSTGFVTHLKDASTEQLFDNNILNLYDSNDDTRILCTIHLRRGVDTNYYFETYPSDDGEYEAQNNS